MESNIELAEGQKSSSDDSAGIARTMINWMVDGIGSISVRPGIVTDSRLISGDNSSVGKGVIGVYVWKSVADGFFYAVHVLQDRTIWALSFQTGILFALSTADPLTKLDGSASQVSFAEDSLRLIMAGGGQLQQWTGAGVTSRLSAYILGVNQPPRLCTHVVNVGNYLVVNDTSADTANKIIWSNIGDGNHSLFDPLNFNTADADPDPVLAIGANNREIIAFGSKTMQVFGLTPDPFLPFASSTALRIGTVAPYSVITDDSDFKFLDDQRRFIASDGRQWNWIGKDVFFLVKEMETVSDCFGFAIKIGYWDLLVWVFPTEKTALVYDQERKDWRQWKGWNNVDDYDAIRISCYATFQEEGLHIVGDPLFSNLWSMNASVPFDQGPQLPIVAEKITGANDYDTSGEKFCEKIRFFLKRGESAVSSGPAKLDLAVSNDGKSWTAQALLDLGTAGDYVSFRDYFPGGVFTRRQHRIRYSSGVALSITKATEFWSPASE